MDLGNLGQQVRTHLDSEKPARSSDGIELLAVVQEDALLDGRLHLGSLEGPALQHLDLPYTLDVDREIQR